MQVKLSMLPSWNSKYGDYTCIQSSVFTVSLSLVSYNGSRLLDTVESYDPIENTWCLHEGSRMNNERCDTGMCVVRFLGYAESPTLNPPTTSTLTTTRETSSRQLTGTVQRTQSDIPSYRIPMVDPEVTSQVTEEHTLDRLLAHPNPFVPILSATADGSNGRRPGGPYACPSATVSSGLPSNTTSAISSTSRWPLQFRRRVAPTAQQFPPSNDAPIRSPLSTTPAGLPMQRPVRQLLPLTTTATTTSSSGSPDGIHRGGLSRSHQHPTSDTSPLALTPPLSRSLFLPRNRNLHDSGTGARLPRLDLMSDEHGNRSHQPNTNHDLLVRIPQALGISDHTESDTSVELTLTDELMPMRIQSQADEEDEQEVVSASDLSLQPRTVLSRELVEPTEGEIEEGEGEEAVGVENAVVSVTSLQASSIIWPPNMAHCQPTGDVVSCSGSLTDYRTAFSPPRRTSLYQSRDTLSPPLCFHHKASSDLGYGGIPLPESSRHSQLSRSDCDLSRLMRQKPTPWSFAPPAGSIGESAPSEIALANADLARIDRLFADPSLALNGGKDNLDNPLMSSRNPVSSCSSKSHLICGRTTQVDPHAHNTVATCQSVLQDQLHSLRDNYDLWATVEQQSHQVVPCCNADAAVTFGDSFADGCEANTEAVAITTIASSQHGAKVDCLSAKQSVSQKPTDSQRTLGLVLTSPPPDCSACGDYTDCPELRPRGSRSLNYTPTGSSRQDVLVEPADAVAEPQDLRSDGEGEEEEEEGAQGSLSTSTTVSTSMCHANPSLPGVWDRVQPR